MNDKATTIVISPRMRALRGAPLTAEQKNAIQAFVKSRPPRKAFFDVSAYEAARLAFIRAKQRRHKNGMQGEIARAERDVKWKSDPFKAACELSDAIAVLKSRDLPKTQQAVWAQKVQQLDNFFTPAAKRAVIERDRFIWNAARAVLGRGSATNWTHIHKQLVRQGVYRRFNKKANKWRDLAPSEGWDILRRLFNLPPGKPGRPPKGK